MTPYIYIVIRKDLKDEWKLVQACHAALEAGFEFNNPEQTVHLVVLQTENEWELEEISKYLLETGIRNKMFKEGYCNIGHTALATEPVEKQTEGILRNLPLFKYQ